MKLSPQPPPRTPDLAQLQHQVRRARTGAARAIERLAQAMRRYAEACEAATQQDISCPPVPYISRLGHRLD